MGGKIGNWLCSERGRKWLGELGNIVLGVLIALALGAVASEIGWKIEVAKARDSLSVELGEIIGQGRERESANRCIETRLDTIGAILDKAETDGRLPAVGPIGNPMFRTWSTDVWNSTVSADIATHMDRDELDNYSGVYEFVSLETRETQTAMTAWIKLYGIVGPGRPITPQEINELRGALSQMRMSHRLLLLAGVRGEQTANRFGLRYDRNTVAEYSRLKSDTQAMCRQLPPADGRPYGQAPYADIARNLRNSPPYRP